MKPCKFCDAPCESGVCETCKRQIQATRDYNRQQNMVKCPSCGHEFSKED